MRLRILFSALLAVGLAVGQPAVGDDSTNGELGDLSGMSVEDMLAAMKSAAGDISTLKKSVDKMDSSARNEVEGRLDCVSNNKAQIGALDQVVARATKALADMQKSGGPINRSKVELMYRQVMIAKDSSNTLHSSAEQCAAGGLSGDGSSSVTLQSEPDDGGVDETVAAIENLLSLGGDPPNASPF